MKAPAKKREPTEDPARPQGAPAAAGTAAAKVSATVGIVAAMVLAVVANLYVARHYKRWDVTRGGLYTLSEPTLQTLHGLEEPLQVYVLLPAGDPLTLSVEHMLEAYRAETTRLDVQITDPDRHPAEFLAIQQKYDVKVAQSDDGSLRTDAAIIVARRDKPHFIPKEELVAIDDPEDMRVRPRLEEAITTAIRSVTSGKRPRLCFSTGHGEKPLDVGGPAGLAALKEVLTKNNYDTLEIAPARAGEKEELPGCDTLVIAGPSEPVPPEDVARFAGFVRSGGSALVAVDPVFRDKRAVDLGLGELFAAIGLKHEADYVFEVDPKKKPPDSAGEIFSPDMKPHAITGGLMKYADRGVGIILAEASSMTKIPGEAAASPLLVTSDKAFGRVGVGEPSTDQAPEPAEGDHRGPLTVAWAVELPKRAGSSADHGARAIALGSSSLLVSSNWQQPQLYGNQVFTENAITWLVSRPALVSLPKKPAVTAGLRLSEEDMKRLALYTVVCMPLATVLFGVAVFLRRRAGERRGTKETKRDPKRAAKRDDEDSA